MNNRNTAWAVVFVWRGLAYGVKLIADKEEAWSYAHRLHETILQDEDRSVFEVSIPTEAIRS